MSEALESLLPCPCGAEAELHEWEERDATRWAARAKCNCGGEGPIGYADNHRGCFDAVNDLHKKRAIAKWNNRPAKTEVAPEDEIEWLHAWLNTAQRTGIESVIPIMRKRMQKLMIGKGDMCPRPSVDIDAAVKVYEDAACKEIYKMREGVAAVLRYAQQAEIDPLSPEGQRQLYERSPVEEAVAEDVGVVQNYCAWPTCRGECMLDSRPQATQTKREPYGVLVAHKKIPNAVQEFIPMKFYGNHKWSDDYSKVTVYIKPPLSLSEEERDALETAVENLTHHKALNGPAQRAIPVIEALLERKE
jgi:hypothetical protein